MITLNDLTTTELKKVMRLRQKVEAIERKMAEILKNAEKRPAQFGVSVRHLSLPRKAQPSLRELITGILAKAKKPMSVSDIYEATLGAGYQWRSQDPINALNVKMYTDRTFKKDAPGRFVLRSKSK